MDYSIKSGDCLWNIVKNNYRTKDGKELNNTQIANTVNSIAKTNNIENPNLIFAGDTLNLEAYDTFTLQSKDVDDPDDDPDADPNAGAEPTSKGEKGSKNSEPPENTGDSGNSNAVTVKYSTDSPYTEYGQWAKDIMDNAKTAGDTAYMQAKEKGFSEKKSSVKYSEAYNAAMENLPLFSVLKEGEKIEDYIESLSAYERIAQQQLEAADTVDNDSTISLKEFLLEATNSEEELHFDENELDAFVSIYNSNPDIVKYMNNGESLLQIANSHNFFDLNGDGVLDIDEIKEYYYILDASDNEVDGKIEFGSYAHWSNPGEIIDAEEKKKNYVEQYKKLHPDKFE